jgi:hypothetical protein
MRLARRRSRQHQLSANASLLHRRRPILRRFLPNHRRRSPRTTQRLKTGRLRFVLPGGSAAPSGDVSCPGGARNASPARTSRAVFGALAELFCRVARASRVLVSASRGNNLSLLPALRSSLFPLPPPLLLARRLRLRFEVCPLIPDISPVMRDNLFWGAHAASVLVSAASRNNLFFKNLYV